MLALKTWIGLSLLRLMPLTLPLELFYFKWAMTTWNTLLHSSLGRCSWTRPITQSTTRKCWQLSPPCQNGRITQWMPATLLSSGQITSCWNASSFLRDLAREKLGGIIPWHTTSSRLILRREIWIILLTCWVATPVHKFDKQELNDFNNITLLPNTFFHVDKSPATLRDRILDAQTYDLFSQRKLLEIEQATSSFKTGCFMANNNSL